MATRAPGNCAVKLFAIFAVTVGVILLGAFVLRFGRFLAGFGSSPLDFDNIFLRIIVNWTMVSCYLYSPGMVSFAVQKIGNLSGLPSSYFKFTNIILLAAILNVIHIYTFILRVIITHWQAIPEVCLWQLNYADHTNFYVHCSMWIVFFMVLLAIDITEITGLKPIFYHLTNRNYLKSQQFEWYLSNNALPESTCLIIVLWAQKIMSLDRFMLATVWTLGILFSNQTDDIDMKYVARQIEKKRSTIYFTKRILCHD